MRSSGHAIEVRLCAEDAEQTSCRRAACCGLWQPPRAAARRACAACGTEITPYYDSMIAKIISHGATATRRAASWSPDWPTPRALGVKTNQAFLRALPGAPGVRRRRRDHRRSSSSRPRAAEPATQAADQRAGALAAAAVARDVAGRAADAGRGFVLSPALPRRVALRNRRPRADRHADAPGSPAPSTSCWAAQRLEIDVHRACRRARAIRLRRCDGERRLARDGDRLWLRTAAPRSRSSTPRARRAHGTGRRGRRPVARVDERPCRRGAGHASVNASLRASRWSRWRR